MPSYNFGPPLPTANEHVNPAFQEDDVKVPPKTDPHTTHTGDIPSSNHDTSPNDNDVKLDICNGSLPKDEDEEEDDESDFFEEEDFEDTCWSRNVTTLCGKFHGCMSKNKKVLRILFFVIVGLLFVTYFIYTAIYDPRKAIALYVLTGFAVLIGLVHLISRYCGKPIARCWEGYTVCMDKSWKYLRWVVYVLLIAAFAVFIGLDVAQDPRRLVSLAGLVFLVLITFLFSKNPARVKWRPVIWGLALQLIFGLIVLRWHSGLLAVEWFTNQVITFLNYADEGSKFVFGEETYLMHPFAFQSLPVVIYISAVITVLYHWGAMQAVIRFMARFMQFTMKTTALESVVTASNIFVSYLEVMPVLLPYIDKLTNSELHCVLVSGFSSTAGSILAIYVHFLGQQHAPHLISACIVSAPAAIAISKLSYPETRVSRTKTQQDVNLPKGKEKSFIEAAANGAMMAIGLVAGIAACLIAFIGIVSFLNAVLSWLGGMAGYPQFSFQEICSYVFWPLAVMMGVDVEDARRVATQMGLKIFIDDVLCYADLGEAVRAGQVSDRSAVIATYACCGFGSLGAMGVLLGAMLAINPLRKATITSLVPRALINGNITAFMTACIAGLLYNGPATDLYEGQAINSTLTNSTMSWIATTVQP